MSHDWVSEIEDADDALTEVIVTGKIGNGAKEGCITCPKEYPLEFKDIPSYREYKISGTCQKCQDEVFREEDQ